jgi:hypothetical protein
MTNSNKKMLKAGVAGAALAFGLLTAMPMLPEIGGLGGTAAWAQGQGQGGQGGGGGGGRPEGRGQGGSGGSVGSVPEGRGQGRPATTGAPTGRGGDSGQRGPSADSDGTPHRGQPAAGERGGRPVWAGDGAIPVVELGRMNVARAPARVLDTRYTELLANWNATIGATSMDLVINGVPTTMTVAQLYSLPAAQFAAILASNYAVIVRVDSPLENLGIYRDVRTDGVTQLTNVAPASALDLAAIALGSASDKNIPITENTVIAMNTILQLPTLSGTELSYVALQAEAVRLAILSGHG